MNSHSSLDRPTIFLLELGRKNEKTIAMKVVRTPSIRKSWYTQSVHNGGNVG